MKNIKNLSIEVTESDEIILLSISGNAMIEYCHEVLSELSGIFNQHINSTKKFVVELGADLSADSSTIAALLQVFQQSRFSLRTLSPEIEQMLHLFRCDQLFTDVKSEYNSDTASVF